MSQRSVERYQEFGNYCDPAAVLVHELESSVNMHGFRAVVVTQKAAMNHSSIPAHLGIPHTEAIAGKVFIQIAHYNERFVAHTDAKLKFVVDIDEYLELYKFFHYDWPRVVAKIKFNIRHMREATQPIRLTNHLYFYHHGYTIYKTTLGQKLLLRARSDSQDKVMDRVTCWIKYADITAPHSNNQLELPLNTLHDMFSDKRALEMLTAHVYKHVCRQ